MEGPIGTFSINMSCHFNPRTYSILPFHYYYADLYNEPMFAFARNKVINSSSYNIWDIYLGNKYFDNIIDENEIKLPFDSYFRGFETVLFRNSWFEKDSIFVGMHGGKQDIAHGTLDAGQFQIQAMEQDWAISLGGENYHVKGWWEHYSVPYEGDEEEIIGRFSYYRARAEGRNCLIFNPDKRTEQCPKAITSFVNTKFNKSESFAVLDLYNAYYRDVECYKRGLRFDKINEIIYLNDEFKVKSKSEVLWIMHTKGDIEMSNDCQKVICTLNGKKMYLEVNTKNVQGKFETLKGEEPLCTSPKVDISYEPYHKRESDRKKLIYRANCEGECYINIAFYFKENKRSNIKCIELW
jgi:hypothetical protein